MFVVTLSKTSLKKLGAGAACCALVVFSAMLGRFISTRTVAVAAPVNRIESAQDIQTWFTGYGLEVDGASITADKVKIPRKWDDSFSAFNGVVQQSGMDLARYKGKTVEKWSALLPAASSGETSRYGVLLVYKKKAVGAYLLEKPSGTVSIRFRCDKGKNPFAASIKQGRASGTYGSRNPQRHFKSLANTFRTSGRIVLCHKGTQRRTESLRSVPSYSLQLPACRQSHYPQISSLCRCRTPHEQANQREKDIQQSHRQPDFED